MKCPSGQAAKLALRMLSPAFTANRISSQARAIATLRASTASPGSMTGLSQKRASMLYVLEVTVPQLPFYPKPNEVLGPWLIPTQP